MMIGLILAGAALAAAAVVFVSRYIAVTMDKRIA